MTKFNFLWIDDDEGKVDPYTKVIEHRLAGFPDGSTLEKLIVKNDLLDMLNQRTKGLAPDLIIIDQVFTRIRLPLKLKGSTVAHLLRANWPKVPMVCVTAEKNKFDQEDISEYTAVFEYSKLDSHIEEIYAIARDFTKISITGKKVRDNLAKLVGVPATEKSLFLRVLPAEIDVGGHPTTQHRIARWIFNTFMVKPGFLYNKLRAATYLGLKESGLDKVSVALEPARYRGPFSANSKPLWWVSELEKVILQITPADGPDTTQLMGRALTGITEQDYSSCYVGENANDVPDVVARLTGSNDEKAVCARHTQNDPNDKSINPGFESLLVIRGVE